MPYTVFHWDEREWHPRQDAFARRVSAMPRRERPAFGGTGVVSTQGGGSPTLSARISSSTKSPRATIEASSPPTVKRLPCVSNPLRLYSPVRPYVRQDQLWAVAVDELDVQYVVRARIVAAARE